MDYKVNLAPRAIDDLRDIVMPEVRIDCGVSFMPAI